MVKPEFSSLDAQATLAMVKHMCTHGMHNTYRILCLAKAANIAWTRAAKLLHSQPEIFIMPSVEGGYMINVFSEFRGDLDQIEAHLNEMSGTLDQVSTRRMISGF